MWLRIARKGANRQQLPPPYDGKKMIPASFILDRKGTIQFVRHGAMTAEELNSLVRNADDFPGVPKRISAALPSDPDFIDHPGRRPAG